MNFFDFIFWQNFVSNSFATLIGIVIGIPVALLIDRLIKTKQEKEKIQEIKKARDQQKHQLLILIRDTLQKNFDLVNQIHDELKPEVVIFYNVDTLLLESISSIKYETIDDLDLNRRLDSIRYELLHLHRKIDLQLEIQYSAYRVMDNYPVVRSQIIRAVQDHLPRIIQEISETREIINAQL